jgi:hypothetical protein
MKAFWLLFIVFVMGAATTGYFAVKSAQPQAALPPKQVVFSPESLDLGKIPQKSKQPAKFTITNNTEGPIDLQDVQSGCSCAYAALGKKNLAVGESTELDLLINTGSTRGEMKRPIPVMWKTHDGILKVRQVVIQGFVEPDILLEPESLQFQAGVAGSAILKLKPGAMSDFEITKFAGTKNAISVERDPKDVRRFTVTYKPTSNKLELDRPVHVLLMTTSENEPNIYVPVRFVEPSSPMER